MAAEIAAAQGISRGRAAGQLRIGLALADRLPRFGALFAAGVVDFQLVSAVVHRSEVMLDPGAIPRLDRWLERNAPRWGTWSRSRIVEAVDYWVQVLEPAAAREARSIDETRHIRPRIRSNRGRVGIEHRFDCIRGSDRISVMSRDIGDSSVSGHR
ncbi:hypothetical protein MTER_11730 [Mycolicibacter terrae]|uniref:DUF222 domain-containing protein n=1 Tax=Mycolicibacter terrae TaxID=1788 RepID=A0AAD1MEV9_9MYCO|nr:DUF222 domain-containing protein [Mycolicibacter terrae]ORW89318.1 hypothetical protein AWC28_19100 [Mycolicibacter terrae]BBX21762.1 hypothetical protein MTER_11730 [Mycolicibacter terrae]SNV85894.1 protein of uncharacterised function DUF222 [Mycolicibacter terrae]